MVTLTVELTAELTATLTVGLAGNLRGEWTAGLCKWVCEDCLLRENYFLMK